MTESAEVVVIGAGFGGLATALSLAERGISVTLLERLGYAGGCAATYTRQQHQFEAGATLYAGLDRNGVLGRWIEEHRLPVDVDILDPAIEFRSPTVSIPVHRERQKFIDEWCALPGAPREAIQRFFRFQQRAAAGLWHFLEDPELLPPWRPTSLLRAGTRAISVAPLLPWITRPLEDLLRAHRLEQFTPLRDYLDSASQITVQCGVDEAEVSFALGAIDYVHRGAAHVRGGIGALSAALVDRIRQLGGTVSLACRATEITRGDASWRIETRRGPIEANWVVANLLPTQLRQFSFASTWPVAERLEELSSPLRDAWGACMLYRTIRDDGLSPAPHHLQLRRRVGGRAIEGEHVFCSLSGAGDGQRSPRPGERTMTVSTHVPLERWRRANDPGAYVERVQAVMRETIRSLAPELDERTTQEWTASPRTFERFTGRPEGCVGGIPRRAGLDHYLKIGPQRIAPNFALVGDSVFPGQSILATALGGVRVAEMIARSR